MKATGIVRPIDELGRVVIPKELRKRFSITEGKDSVEIFIENDSIIFKKYEPACIFCKETEDLMTFGGRNICADCIKKMHEQI